MSAAVELPAWQLRAVARTSCSTPSCGKPGRQLMNRRACPDHMPELPGGAYCAPGRCYCPGGVCVRPAP